METFFPPIRPVILNLTISNHETEPSQRSEQQRSAEALRSPSSVVPACGTRNADGLIEWNDLLDWQKDNEYIITGYRQASYSISNSLKSIFRLHNETVNIWSHLIGALAFLALGLYWTSRTLGGFPDVVVLDIIALAVFFLGVVVCFVLSTSFHTFLNHSKEAHVFGNQLDHLGVVLVIWGSTGPSAYFGFYCDPNLRSFYLSLTTLAALGCAISTLQPHFRTPTFRSMRFIMYCGLGISAFIPVVHGILLRGWEIQNQRMALTYFTGLGVLNFCGAAIYAVRIPERWYPRRFDKYGGSHQLMHVLVVCGAISHSIGLVKTFGYWQQESRVGYEACNEGA